MICGHFGWTNRYALDNLSLPELYIWTEEAISQKRAENGIKERIIGTVGTIDDVDQYYDVLEFDPRQVPTANARQLPDDVKWIYLAEKHRLRTGETIPVGVYKALYGESEIDSLSGRNNDDSSPTPSAGRSS